MARTAHMGVLGGRDPRVGRMVGVSALAHATVLGLVLVVLPLVKPSPLPITAYTVELTDSASLGGRQAPGRTDLPPGPRPGTTASAEAAAQQGEPAAKAEAPPPPAPEPPKPIEHAPEPPPPPVAKAPEPPKPAEPAVKLPSLEKPPQPKPEVKKPPEPKPVVEPKKVEPAKVEPKQEAKTPEPTPKPEAKQEAKTPEPPKSAATPAQSNASAKPVEPKTTDAKPTGKPGGRPDGAGGDGDSYAAAADRWRAKGATGGGGGLGGTDTGSGPLGTGYGGGGGQVVGFEFLAYQQRVVSTVKGVWTNVAPRPGLVAKVRFRIAPNGEVSAIQMEQASGNAVFDSSALRAVQRANPLPPPPARYVSEFREFVIEFHSEEGGQAAG